MRTTTILPALLLLLLPAAVAAASADPPPRVKVAFTLAEPNYRNELTDPQIRDLAQRVTAFLVGELSREVRFLRFTDQDAPYRLAVRLGNAGASTVSFHDVLFRLDLTGPGVRSDSGASWLFRGTNAWGNGIGSAGQFRTEIETSLGGHDMAELVPQVLSNISVAADGLLVQNQEVGVGWVLPLRNDDVCMDADTEIKVKTQVDTSLGPAPFPFLVKAFMPYNPPGRAGREELRHCLLCLAVPGQPGLDTVRQSQPDKVHVLQVNVMSYARTQVCDPLPPDEAFGGGR